jgi:ADP-dependent NAD(P)H-hydrate dehydratase / NAD(P)H-hydrate epimerase
MLFNRDPNSNKGDHGSVAVVGGAQGTVGAVFLAARTALYSGVGRVFVVRPDLTDGVLLDPLHPELMVISFAQANDKPITTWAIGPGLGMSPAAHQILSSVLASPLPVVIDADALNLMAEDPALGRQCARRNTPTVITPHPGEAARLLGVSIEDIQANRQAAAEKLQRQFNAVAVLKGAGTIISSQDKTVRNTTGNAALATGGTGDVLTGLIGALIAQGMPAFEAAVIGVKLHGLAAENLTTQIGGMIGVTASELIPELRGLINNASVPQSQQ